MATVNSVTLAGYVMAEPQPELRYMPDGDMQAKFYLETFSLRRSHTGSSYQESEKHRIIAWKDKIANLEQVAVPDNFVFVQGRLRTIMLKDKRTKFEFPFTTVQAEQIQVIGKKSDKK
jgi:single-stranded DNA-binding protein